MAVSVKRPLSVAVAWRNLKYTTFPPKLRFLILWFQFKKRPHLVIVHFATSFFFMSSLLIPGMAAYHRERSGRYLRYCQAHV